METYSGESNWRLTARRGPDGVALLRCRTCDARAALPDTLWGEPVTAIGPRALSPSAPEAVGEDVRITCGPASGAWDNQSLSELRLPSGLRSVGDYALYNCRTLERLRLCDGVTRWGNGVLMNCRALERIQIDRTSDGDGGALAYFAGELNRELDVVVTRDGREPVCRLIFPEYRENYEENCPAHHFDYVIEGVGYPYHHCFQGKKLNLTEYDALWEKSRGMETATALRLAWWRVRYPEGLSDAARTRYLDALRSYGRETAEWLLSERDASGLAFFLRCVRPDADTLSYAASLARERSQTEALALLLDERRRFAVPDASRFAL